MRGSRVDWHRGSPVASEHSTFRSLDYFGISKIQRLAVTMYGFPMHDENDESTYYILGIMKELHTLFLNQCNNLLFTLALNPDRNPQKLIPCPKLENLIFCIEDQGSFNIRVVINMARERASKGAQLRSIVVISQGELVPENEVIELREYAEYVEWRFEERQFRWDGIPDYRRNWSWEG